MIVLPQHDGGLLLIRQTDHAKASGELARQWRRPGVFPAQTWDLLIDAVAHHDDGWIETENTPVLCPDGSPCDFKKLPEADHVAIWQRSIALAAERDPYIALVVAMHARRLYTEVIPARVETDPGVVIEFLAHLNEQTDDWINALTCGSPAMRSAVRPHNLEKARALLSFMDSVTLGLLGAIDRVTTTHPLAFAHESAPIRLTYESGKVTLNPWPFEGRCLTLSMPAVYVARKVFASQDALHEANRQGEKRTLGWTITAGE